MLINKIFLVGYFPNPLDPSKKKKKKGHKIILNPDKLFKGKIDQDCLLLTLKLRFA